MRYWIYCVNITKYQECRDELSEKNITVREKPEIESSDVILFIYIIPKPKKVEKCLFARAKFNKYDDMDDGSFLVLLDQVETFDPIDMREIIKNLSQDSKLKSFYRYRVQIKDQFVLINSPIARMIICAIDKISKEIEDEIYKNVLINLQNEELIGNIPMLVILCDNIENLQLESLMSHIFDCDECDKTDNDSILIKLYKTWKSSDITFYKVKQSHARFEDIFFHYLNGKKYYNSDDDASEIEVFYVIDGFYKHCLLIHYNISLL